MRRSLSVGFALTIALFVAGACADEVVTPDASTPLTATASACEPPADPAVFDALVQQLEGTVDALEDAGSLNGGQARALRRHLDNAARQQGRDEYCAARDQLTAFREQLEDLVGTGSLGDREAYDLRHALRLALATEVIQPGDPEAYAPGVVGEPRTVWFGGEQLNAVVIDGLAIFTGDIILGFADELDAGGAGAAGDPDGPLASGPCSGCTRWEGPIGFSYADDWGASNVSMRARINEAIDHLRLNTGFSFYEKHDNPDILFRNSMGCSSPVGRRVVTGLEAHSINIGTGCGSGTIVHEIMHSLGIWHEQSRTDRDAFVDVQLDNVTDGMEFNFEQYGSSGWDVGTYDYGSMMHYGCGDFRADDATGNPITPLAPGVTCADLRNRGGMTPLDIAGVYLVDDVDYSIVGADWGETADRFELSLDWVSEPVHPSYIEWALFGGGVVGTGPTFSTADAGLANGDYRIRVSLAIGGVNLYARDIEFTIDNSPPTVDLGLDLTVEEWATFELSATVSDGEGGLCPASVCTYTWDPAPLVDRGAIAEFRRVGVGDYPISLTVTDQAGATASDEVVVTVVNSPPTAVIESPADGSVFSPGAVAFLRGFATDPNWDQGAGGRIDCRTYLFEWTSSDPTDVVNEVDGCTGTITFGDPGPRTLTLAAHQGNFVDGTTSVTLEVAECGTSGCAPSAYMQFATPVAFTGSDFGQTFVQPGFYYERPLDLEGFVTDPDFPPTTISYSWRVQPPCFGGCPDFELESGTVLPPNGIYATWSPSADPRVPRWDNCTATPLPFRIDLHLTDINGNTRVVSRTIYLACELV